MSPWGWGGGDRFPLVGSLPLREVFPKGRSPIMQDIPFWEVCPYIKAVSSWCGASEWKVKDVPFREESK